MNVLTVLNEDYCSYGRIFFDSLIKISDFERINKVYVIDTGIKQNTKKEFSSKYKKINFINSEVNHLKTSHNTADWREIVATKVKGLASLVREGKPPICMIDIDCYFKDNFIDEIDFSADINVCKRKEPAVFRWPVVMTHIASFFCVNNNKQGLDFLNMWIDKMLNMEDTHIETPALCELIPQVEHMLYIKHLDQDVVSSDSLTKESKIVHLKGGGSGYKSTFDWRVKRIESVINKDNYI